MSKSKKISHKSAAVYSFPSSSTFLIIISVQLLAFFSWLIYWYSPSTSDLLVQEDGFVENVQAIFLLLSSALFFYVANTFRHYRKYTITTLALLCGLVLIVLFLEEMSWFQRILLIESNEYFLENNAQAETNFHNLSTHLFQNIYYFGGFMLFSLLPFFRTSILNLLRRANNLFVAATVLLPSRWLIVPFSVISAFMWPTADIYPTIILSYLGALLLVIITVYRMMIARLIRETTVSLISVGLIILIGYTTLFNGELSSIRSGAPTEHTETFIAIGIIVYSLDVVIRMVRNGDLYSKSIKKIARIELKNSTIGKHN